MYIFTLGACRGRQRGFNTKHYDPCIQLLLLQLSLHKSYILRATEARTELIKMLKPKLVADIL